MIVIVFTIVALAVERYLFVRQNSRSSRKMLKKGRNSYFCSLFSHAVCNDVLKMYKTSSIMLNYDYFTRIHECSSIMDLRTELISTCLKWLLAFLLRYSVIIIFCVLLIHVFLENLILILIKDQMYCRHGM
jgi:hypothetical protein